MVTSVSSNSSYFSALESRQEADKTVKSSKGATNSDSTQTAAKSRNSYIDELMVKQNVEKLSEKLQSTYLYTKEASKVVAEMMLSPKRIELVA